MSRSSGSGDQMRRTQKRLALRELKIALPFIAPWIIGFSTFLLGPILLSFYYSLCDFSVLQPPEFIGPANYLGLVRDDVFLTALSNTLYYAGLAIPLGVVVSLTLALLLNTGVAGMAFYRTIFYLPTMVPAIALAILWLWILNGKHGVLNYALGRMPAGAILAALALLSPLLLAGLFRAFTRSARPAQIAARWAGMVTGLMIILALFVAGQFSPGSALIELELAPPGWLSEARWVKGAFVLTSLWGAGNAMVIYLAGLQDVPQHLYESADLDGASWWQKILFVTLPTISPVILFNGVMAIIGAFNYFAIPYVMAPGGQPARSAYFLAVALYDNAFTYLRMGYASAMAWVLFVIILALTYAAFRFSERHVHYGEG